MADRFDGSQPAISKNLKVLPVIHSGFVRAVDLSDYPFGWGYFMGRLWEVSAEL